MGTMYNVPGSCCCCDCILYEDDFSGDLARWTQVSGTWSIVSQRIRCSDAGALVLCTREGTTNHSFEVYGTSTTIGDSFRIYAAYKDSNNHVYVEFEKVSFSVATAELHEVILGVDTLLDSYSYGGIAAYHAICVRNGEVVCTPSVVDGFPTSQRLFGTVSDAAALGTQIGIGIVSASTYIEFDNVELRSLQSDVCPNCLAPPCLAETEFTSASVTFSGVADTGDSYCSDCEDWNAAYILDSVDGNPSSYAQLISDGEPWNQTPPTNLPACMWVVSDSLDLKWGVWAYHEVRLTVFCENEDVKARVSVYVVKNIFNPFSNYYYEEARGEVTLGTKPDCCKVDCLELLNGRDIQMSTIGTFPPFCDWDSATATVTTQRSV